MKTKQILTSSEVRARYEELLVSKKITRQQRGFELENLLRSVLEIENLEPKASYRKTGEQMDGSFFWMGQTFLFEAKWEKNKIAASTIYAFKGKVDGKFHTSSGIFIAMNGYGDDTEEALTTGKVSNILLFDGEDIAAIFNGTVTFVDALKYKLRVAGDTGALYSKYSTLVEVKLAAGAKEIKADLIDTIDNSTSASDLMLSDLLVFIEGKDDFSITKNILDFSIGNFGLSYRIIALQGASNVAKIPSFISTYQGVRQIKGVIVFLDQDTENNRLKTILENVSEQLSNASISINNIIVFLDEKSKLAFSIMPSKNGTAKTRGIRDRLRSFFDQTAEEYYDPEEFSPVEILPSLLKELQWDRSEKCVYFTDEYSGIPGSLRTLDALVDHLNEILVSSRLSDLPLEWIKEMDSIDYSWEIREYLSDYCKTKIKRMGWEI